MAARTDFGLDKPRLPAGADGAGRCAMIQRANEHSEGERRKLEALVLLEARRAVYLNRGRRALLAALLAALLGSENATADDVREAIKLPSNISPKCLGAVPGTLARAGIIRRAGFANTTRSIGHARPVSVWELADRDKALQWLRDHPDRDDPDGENTTDLFANLPTKPKSSVAATTEPE
jgi:hypothetical protein